MQIDLKNKVALITGSTSGIGLTVAQILAKAGANIVLNGLGDLQQIEQIRQNLEKEFKVKAIFANFNLLKPSEIKKMIEYINTHLGGVDILINNAGM